MTLTEAVIMNKEEAKKQFGKNLKELRLKMNMSQDELAKKIGYKGRSAINKIETGVNDMPRETVIRCAEALGVSPIELFKGTVEIEDTGSATDNDRLIKFGEYIRLLRETEGLSQEELAKKSGFAGRAAISALEKGKTNISIDRLQDLAVALHTTPGTMLDVLVETNETSLTDGLNAENIAKLRSYAAYLKSTQEENK